jgi:hypothetical protein
MHRSLITSGLMSLAMSRIAFPLHPTRSARLSGDFTAQYSAYGFPCQRLTRQLTMQSP